MKQTKSIIFVNMLFSLIITIFSYNTTGNIGINEEVLVKNGAIVPYNSHFITLLTAMFLHGSYFHLFINMISLYILGKKVEPILKKIYLPVYLILGIFINLLGYFWYSSETFIIGASGAICIIWGISLFLTFKSGNKKTIKQDSIDLLLFISITLISEIFDFPIANFIHISGIILGLLFAYLFILLKTNKRLILIK